MKYLSKDSILNVLILISALFFLFGCSGTKPATKPTPTEQPTTERQPKEGRTGRETSIKTRDSYSCETFTTSTTSTLSNSKSNAHTSSSCNEGRMDRCESAPGTRNEL